MEDYGKVGTVIDFIIYISPVLGSIFLAGGITIRLWISIAKMDGRIVANKNLSDKQIENIKDAIKANSERLEARALADRSHLDAQIKNMYHSINSLSDHGSDLKGDTKRTFEWQADAIERRFKDLNSPIDEIRTHISNLNIKVAQLEAKQTNSNGH